MLLNITAVTLTHTDKHRGIIIVMRYGCVSKAGSTITE